MDDDPDLLFTSFARAAREAAAGGEKVLRGHAAALLSLESITAPSELREALDWLLLSGYLHVGAEADGVAHDEIRELLCSRGAPAALEELSARAPQRVCSKTFSYGDVIWKCKTCQVGDDTCVICQSCFQDGDHDGHDVSFYISRQTDGGCCDCGDDGAWAPRGFCRRHGKLHTTEELLGSVPPPLLRAASPLFAEIFGRLYALLQSSVRLARPAPPPALRRPPCAARPAPPALSRGRRPPAACRRRCTSRSTTRRRCSSA